MPIKPAALPQDSVPPRPRPCFIPTLSASYPGSEASAMLSLGQRGDPQRDDLPSSQAVPRPRMNQVPPPGNVSLPSSQPPPRRGLRSGWWEWARGGGGRGSRKTPVGMRTEWGAKDGGMGCKLLHVTGQEEREEGGGKELEGGERGGVCVCVCVCLSVGRVQLLPRAWYHTQSL